MLDATVKSIQLFGYALIAGAWYVATIVSAPILPPLEMSSVTIPSAYVSAFIFGNVLLLVVTFEASDSEVQ